MPTAKHGTAVVHLHRPARKTAKRRGQARRYSNGNRNTFDRREMGRAIREQANLLGLSRERMAQAVNDAASQVSRLMTGHYDDFSIDRLARWATRLGMNVEMTVRPNRNAEMLVSRRKTKITQYGTASLRVLR